MTTTTHTTYDVHALPAALLDQVRAYLQNRHLFLVLDNAEHLLDAVAPLVAELLTTCPGLTVLATSAAIDPDSSAFKEIVPASVSSRGSVMSSA